jgi:hypothetical protein
MLHGAGIVAHICVILEVISGNYLALWSGEGLPTNYLRASRFSIVMLIYQRVIHNYV